MSFGGAAPGLGIARRLDVQLGVQPGVGVEGRTMTALLTSGERRVAVPAGHLTLPGTLAWPSHPSGMVLFAQGSGESGLDRRNVKVAQQLRRAGLATLLVELVGPRETTRPDGVFEIELVADRLRVATEWVVEQPEMAGLIPGYFGTGPGAAAALHAAAVGDTQVGALVLHGGRLELAGDALACVGAPTLLIAGGHDEAALELNRQSYRRLRCPKQLLVLPGTTPLLDEPGALEAAGRAAAGWLIEHLVLVPRWQVARR